jgi:hypothetical protein
MIYICGLHAGINYYTLAVEKDHDSIFTTIWKPGFSCSRAQCIKRMTNFKHDY